MRYAFKSVLIIASLAMTAALFACGNDDLAHDVAYVSENEQGHVYLLDRSGETSKVISDPVSNIKWAPNRSSLAYLASEEGEAGQLKIWRRETGNSERVPGSTGQVKDFFWSPDSRMIAYQSNSADEPRTEVYVYDFVEEDTTLLASEPVGNIELGNWSGDNRWIVMCLILDGTKGIFKRSVKGVDEVQLTDSDDSRPRFSYDGKNVAFARQQPDGTTDIYTILVEPNSDLGEAKVLTDEPGDETDFEWAPDSKRIIYVAGHDGNPEIYSIETESKTTRRMTQNRFADADPKWSLNGEEVLFRSDTDGKYHLFAMNHDSGLQERLLKGSNSIVTADW